MKRRVLAVLLTGAMALGLAACGGSDEAKDTSSTTDTTAEATTAESGTEEIKIGVLLKPESNEYWSSMKAGIEEWASAQEGVTVDILCA